MCAFVMKGREGMQGVIKGMVMRRVKKKINKKKDP